MDSKKIDREQISALADGEHVDAQLNAALAMCQPEEMITWDLYHQIGEVLRSDDMAFSLSRGFSARMSARLDAEPTVIAPQLKTSVAEQIAVAVAVAGNGASSRKRFVRRFAMPGAMLVVAAAAVGVLALVTMPQQPVTMVNNGTAATTVAIAASPENTVQINRLAQQGEVSRDPRIDDYLLAHQRFSPSLYSSVQYARSAAFAMDADK